MMPPLVSVVSAVYNKADVLADTLRRLTEQRGIPADAIEFVFVDDGSTDGSLAFLQARAEADSRIRVSAPGGNLGPSIRFNQAAALAKGRYLLAVDADDMTPANAARFLTDCAARLAVPLVFGRSKRGLDCVEIPENAKVETAGDALAFCADRKIVRMGFLAEREMWLQAGGADETVFIQDQSLPLRLSVAAGRLAYVDAEIYYLRPVAAGNLSNNRLQQHHDRFFSLLPFLDRPGVSPSARRAILRQLVSSVWKMERDSGGRWPILTPAGRAYLLNRLAGLEPSSAFFAAAAARLRECPGIRRPGER